MGSRNYFTQDEITLCTYAALYEASDFGGERQIARLTRRSPASIQMKIQNIAAMLDQAGVRRESVVSPLTGMPQGQSGRMTNWEWVEPLTRVERRALLERCRRIISTAANDV